MAYTEFYCNASTGAQKNAGDNKTVVTSTNGNWSTVTNIFTAAAGTPFSASVAGDFASIYNDGATIAVYIARIITVGGSGATLTLDTTAIAGTAPTTSATGRSCTVGGAWLGPNGTDEFPCNFITATLTDAGGDDPRVNFKNNATYNITAAITVANNGPITYQGYTSTAGDGGRATIDGGTSGVAYNLIFVNKTNLTFTDLIFQHNGASSDAFGIFQSSNTVVYQRVTINNVRGGGWVLGGTTVCTECEAYACNIANAAGNPGFLSNSTAAFIRCLAHDNTTSNTDGFYCGGSNMMMSCVECIADTNGRNGFVSGASGQLIQLDNCTAYNNTAAGVWLAGPTSYFLMDSCDFEANHTYGLNNSAASNFAFLLNCAFYNNTSGQTTGAVDATGTITLGASGLTDAANGDFTPVSTLLNKGRGSFIQDAGSYTKTTTSFPDVGAVMHKGGCCRLVGYGGGLIGGN